MEAATRPSGRRRGWTRRALIGASVFLVLAAGLLGALPGLLRWAIARELAALTGEPVMVAAVRPEPVQSPPGGRGPPPRSRLGPPPRPLRAPGRAVPSAAARGRAALTAAAAQHLQRVADVLRASPFVRLALRPAVTEADPSSPGPRGGVGAIQQAQHEQGLADFAAAARQVFARRAPGRPVPERSEDLV